MDYMVIWATEQFKFGLLMMCCGIVFGALCTYGVMRWIHPVLRDGVDELYQDESP